MGAREFREMYGLKYQMPDTNNNLKMSRLKMNHLTPNELLIVLRMAKSHSARDWAMILLAYRHGMRASEVCAVSSKAT